MYMFEHAPRTVMFWLFPDNTTLQSTTTTTEDDDDDLNPVDIMAFGDDIENIIGSYSNPSVIFNTGDYVDETCACTRRILFLYRYDIGAVTAQIWTEDDTGYVQ